MYQRHLVRVALVIGLGLFGACAGIKDPGLEPDSGIEEDAGTDAGSDAGTDAGTDAGVDGVCATRETETEACGLNGRGVRARSCASGAWGSWGECEDPDQCTDGDTREAVCHIEGPKTVQPEHCVEGSFQPEGACVCAEGTEFDSNAEACLAPIACDDTSSPFGGGFGTEADPYRICSGTQLQAVATAPSSHFVLARSLDLTGLTAFQPIGTSTSPFTGRLDGKGRALGRLTVIQTARDGVGLFGVMNAATVRDVTLMGFTVEGRHNVGSLVGDADKSLVEGIVVWNAQITGVLNVGGLVGRNRTGAVNESRVSGKVSGSDGVGGLVGQSYESTVDACAASGEVVGNDSVGGLAGVTASTTPFPPAEIIVDVVRRSYATAKVSGHDKAGGLVGDLQRSTVEASYATGDVSGNDAIGGLVGRNLGGFVGESYATGLVQMLNLGGGLVGNNQGSAVRASFALERGGAFCPGNPPSPPSRLLTRPEFALQGTFADAGWDFASVWMMSTSLERPVLRWQLE